MYSTAKKLTAVSVILSAFCILTALAAIFVYVPSLKLSLAYEFAVVGFIATAAFGHLALTLSLRSALSDLSVAEEANATQIKALKKRIEELEYKANQH